MRFWVKLVVAIVVASIAVIVLSAKHLFASYTDFLMVFFLLVVAVFFILYFSVRAKFLPEVEYEKRFPKMQPPLEEAPPEEEEAEPEEEPTEETEEEFEEPEEEPQSPILKKAPTPKKAIKAQ